jgi:2,3-bisphosphoglycerate-independent phosphoglycerate mutase
MYIEKILPDIIRKNEKKILLMVLDGLGGLPDISTGKTELETAIIPNLNNFAKRGSCGLTIPIAAGITPGSGPAHLALFGYDPVEYQIGRGVLEALGIGMKLGKEDLAIRGNFATIDEKRVVTDRRAGRISTEENAKLVSMLQAEIPEIKGIRCTIRTVKEHRLAIVFSGNGLSPELSENDPEKEGLPLRKIEVLKPEADFTGQVIAEFLTRVEALLAKIDSKAKTILLRGFSRQPEIPGFEEKYKLKAACIASYPMYKGLSRLVGMDVIENLSSFEEQVNTLLKLYDRYDFFFVHYKKTDSSGEDGNFRKKVFALEEFDRLFEKISNLQFEAVAVTGDHSTPSLLKSHSWHPVPIAIVSPNMFSDDVDRFTERSCAKGMLGIFPATNVMYLLLGASLKLNKFGA